MYSNYGRRPSFATPPPLPHQPQAHFYGVPEMDFGLPAAHQVDDGLKPGENGYFCGFDTLATSGDGPSLPAEDVLLVGYQGGMEVCRVNRDRLDILGQLSGLKGSVIGAKIIPWTGRSDPHDGQRPLVALTIHGPVVPEPRDNDTASTAVADDLESESYTRPPSRGADAGPPQITHYQTTVQVYSLRTQQRLATLYTSPAIPVSEPPTSPLFQVPEPVGDIRIDANGKYIVVALGASGEVFIFTQVSRWNSGIKEGFHCIGKVWTTVHYPERRRTASTSGSETSSQSGDLPPQRGIPLFTLSPRTLAVVPPVSSPHFSLNGTALLSQSNAKPAGITTHAAPPPPGVTCSTDMPEGDGILNRVAREMTQEFLKGAQWLGVQGMQAWKSYWNKDASSPRPNGSNYMHDPVAQQAQYFPPTHGHASPPGQSSSEPVIISIFDLQRLVDAEDTRLRNALTPLATFQAPLGCSYISFAPTGLALLTASKKGDFYFIWDLMRMNHGKSAPSGNAPTLSPSVRQIQAISRMTVSNVVDVIWSAPKGEKVAILTEKGTIHIYELPSSAFQWPPPRRALSSDVPRKTSDSDNTAEATSKFGAMSSAMKSINGRTQPFLNAVRQRSKSGDNSAYSSLGGLAIAGANSGKGAVAAGFNKSLGMATNSMNQLYHKDDNKLRLHDTSNGVYPGCIRWLNGKGRGSIAVVAGGLLRIHSVTQTISHRRGKTNVSRALVSKKKDLEYTLQRIPDTLLPPATQAQLDGKGDVSSGKVEGYWTLRAIQRPNTHHRTPNAHPLSYAELETNAPYQPFHTDRRISLHAYTDSGNTTLNEWDLPLASSDPHHVNDGEAWIFGGDIPSARVITGSGAGLDDNLSGEDDLLGGAPVGGMENLTLREGGEPEEQVVVTTRRRRVRKGAQAGGADDEGFFEDDCEVLDFAADRV
jgi:hypothetical protein